MKPLLITLYMYCCLLPAAIAQVLPAPRLLADFCPGEQQQGQLCGGAPYFMQQYNGRLMLSGFNGQRGNLHGYDGLTEMYAYPYPKVWLSQPSYAVIDSVFYFTNYFNGPATQEKEIYAWDGSNTPGRITYIHPDGHSDPSELTVLNGVLYFTATDDTGYGLYEFNPETGATIRLNNLHAIGTTAYNGNLYFSARGASGVELYAYNPLTGTSILLADLNPGPGDSYPQSFLIANSRLYFMATTAAYGREIYMYDGTTQPIRLTDIARGPGNGIGSANGADMTYYNNKLYFTGSMTGSEPYDLWSYDIVTNTPARAAGLYTANITEARSFTVYNGKVFFPGYNRLQNLNHLYTYDIYTGMVQQVPDPAFSRGFTAYLQYVYKDALYLSGQTSNYGWELYRYDDAPPADTTRTIIYPNPATTQATIKTTLGGPRTITITISDVSGRIVMRNLAGTFPSGELEIPIPLTQFAAGVYFVTLYDNIIGALWHDKLVKL